MIIDNYLLAFNGLGLLWLFAGITGLIFLYKFKGEKFYFWLFVLTCLFTFAPIVLLLANRSYPLSSNSNLLHMIVFLITSCFISLYLHTLDLLNIKISITRIFGLYFLAMLLMIPDKMLDGELNKYGVIIRTIAFHGGSILLIALSVKNLIRVQKNVNYLQIRLSINFLFVVAVLFSCRILYGIINPEYLVINPHEKVDFVFFLIRLLLVVFGGLALIFLISMQKYHLIRANPFNKYNSTADYDISTALNERDELIEFLLKTNKNLTIGAVSSSLAHELNQPLSAININLEILKKELQDEKFKYRSTSETIRDIEESINRATNIVRSVSNLSTQNESTPEKNQASVAKVIQDILKITEHNLNLRGIQVIRKIKDCNVLISKTDLEQVLLNIFSNAIKALNSAQNNDPKIISIEINDSLKGLCVIRISNNGGTISEKVSNALFNTIVPSTNNGSGIGLWLCKYILEKNLSKISYESKEPNTAIFKITLRTI